MSVKGTDFNVLKSYNVNGEDAALRKDYSCLSLYGTYIYFKRLKKQHIWSMGFNTFIIKICIPYCTVYGR